MRFTDFVEKYPKYSTNRFSPDVNGNVRFLFNGDDYNPYDKNGNLVKSVYEFPSWEGETPKPENIHDFLNVLESGFPKELEMAKTSYPVVSTPFDKTPPSFDPEEIDIYVKPSQKFTIKPRNIFTGVLKHVTQKEAYKWLGGPDMSYYPQQLAFSVWCASSGCGVGMGMLTKYSPMINSLLKFHILFTSRRILSQMNVPLPGDQYFTNMDNKYNKAGYDKACREFDLSKNSDFRYKGAENGGLGRIYVKIFDEVNDVTVAYNEKMDGKYTNKWPDGVFKFKDEKDYGGYTLDHISPLEKHPYLYFLLNAPKGLTKAGLSRLNQSIEAFVYCILGAQVQTRSSIIGNSGSAQEAQTVFLQLFESSIVGTDISKSIQRYQLAIQESKQKLDLAISPGCWLLPSNLVINNSSIVGYNNKLLKATVNMKFGVNDINAETKTIGHMSHSKIQLPHQNTNPVFLRESTSKKNTVNISKPTNTHGTNLTTITIVVAGLAWLIFR